jgi:1-acyl-sn-glycerol-3-phosphate acyltransferase
MTLSNSDLPFFYTLVKNTAMALFDLLYALEVHDAHYVPLDGPFLIVCNHQSYFDPPLIGGTLPANLHYFARKTLFTPGLGHALLSRLNTIPVDREGGGDVTALKRAFRLLESGKGLLVFPEGTRTPDGQLQPVENGIGLMACKAQVPVVPARIFGAFENYPRTARYPGWKAPMTLRFGPPMTPACYDPGPQAKQRYILAAQRLMQGIADLQHPVAREY